MGEAKFFRVRDGRCYFAEVAVEVESPSAAPGIAFDDSGRSIPRPGWIEGAPVTGHDDWEVGAQAGIAFALSLAGHQRARVIVTRIRGIDVDTNPWVVGAAAAEAVWRALGFEPPERVVSDLEEVVFTSWSRPPDEVPRFG